MKVLIFTTLYPNNVWPHHGIFVKERMERVAKLRDCRVKVVAPVPYFPSLKLGRRWLYSQVAEREIRDSIEVEHPRYFMTPKIGMALYGWMMFLSVLPTVKRIHKSFEFDLIDAHYVFPDGFAAILLGRFFKKPVVVSARGSDINLFRTFPIIRHLLQYVLRKADRVIAVSRPLKGAMIELGVTGDNIEVIPNGVDTTKFYPLSKEKARRELGLPNQRMILSVGNLTPNKGFDLLIRSLAILADRFQQPDVRLGIIGDGAYRRQLQKIISALKLEDRVRLFGSVTHDKLYVWYSAADVFCLASGREGWPNVILEALSCGTPVVATSAGGIPDIICSEKIGLLTERNEWKFAAAISRALKNTWQSDDLVQYAGKHSWERTASAVVGVFESALASKNVRCGEVPTETRTVPSRFRRIL